MCRFLLTPSRLILLLLVQNKPKKAASVPVSTNSPKVKTFTLSQLLVYRTNKRRQQVCRFLPTPSRLILLLLVQNKPKKAASVLVSTNSLKVNTFTLSQLLVYRTNKRRQQVCRFLLIPSRLILLLLVQNKPKKAASVPVSTNSPKVKTFTLSQILVYRTNQRRQQVCQYLRAHSRLTLFAIWAHG